MTRPPTMDEQREQTARLRLAVARLARQIRRHAVDGVTLSQISALVTVERYGPLQPARLAEHEGVSRSTLTRVIRALEDGGLVLREPDPTDGRACLLSISPAGARLLAESRVRADAFMTQRLAALDPQQRDQLALLTELLEHLAEGD